MSSRDVSYVAPGSKVKDSRQVGEQKPSQCVCMSGYKDYERKTETKLLLYETGRSELAAQSCSTVEESTLQLISTVVGFILFVLNQFRIVRFYLKHTYGQFISRKKKCVCPR